jgi:hypothetical protein
MMSEGPWRDRRLARNLGVPRIAAPGRLVSMHGVRTLHTGVSSPECGTGALIKRDGRSGTFLSCSEWRRDGSGCDYTQNVSGRRRSSPVTSQQGDQ